MPTNHPHLLKRIRYTNNLHQSTQELYAVGVSSGLGTVDGNLCKDVLQDVKQQRKYADKTLYKSIHNPNGRHDFFLKLEGAGKHLVKQVLSFWKHNQSPLYQPDAKLIEYACFISLPGNEGQEIHCDTQDPIQHKDAISFGIPLQDTTPSMGPLVVTPNDGADFLSIPVKRGQIYGWSQIVPHGGGANLSNTDRYVLYFTIVYPPVLDIDVGGYSLHPDYKNGILLKQFNS